jgi:hypothetical protein
MKIKTLFADNGILTALCDNGSIWQMKHTLGDWLEIKTPYMQKKQNVAREEEIVEIERGGGELYVPEWMRDSARDIFFTCKGCNFKGEGVLTYRSMRDYGDKFVNADPSNPTFLACCEHTGAIMPLKGFKNEL